MVAWSGVRYTVLATALENLALACVSCSLRKGGRISAVGPDTRNASQLFHPRVEIWNEHVIAASSGEILGRTATGRATMVALRMNRVLAVAIRREEGLRDRWP